MRLSGIFSDGMVLQRDVPCSIWGWETSETKVTASLEGNTYEAQVENGSFRIVLPAHEAATGITIEICGSEKIVLSDVCYGDVFYLGGQSNMELPVYRTRDVSAEEIDASSYPYIRQYRVTPQWHMDEDEVAFLPELSWTKGEGSELEQMSAAGFFCAKRIFDQTKIPIGLVLGAQGGSTIEAWMPTKLLSEFGDFASQIQPFMKEGALTEYLYEQEKITAEWRDHLCCEDDQNYISTIAEKTTEFNVPGMLLQKEGKGFCGIVWFFREVELLEDPGENAFLYLGNLIDADQTFVNGKLVGRTEYRYPPRKYPFDGKILHKGINTITVRLLIEDHNGGFVGAHPYYLETGKEHIPLRGSWKMKPGKTPEYFPHPGVRGQVVPTALFKTSVLPLRDYSFRGMWWYQGESNCDQPARYDEKFQKMIENWRELYQQKLPLICIEMCDYTDPISGVTPAGWDEIQAQQRQAEKDVPDCVVVSAKDLGAPLELHPQKKSELGARMAEAAMKMYYSS